MKKLGRHFHSATGKLKILIVDDLVLEVYENLLLLGCSQLQLRPDLNNKIIVLVPVNAKYKSHITFRSRIIWMFIINRIMAPGPLLPALPSFKHWLLL